MPSFNLPVTCDQLQANSIKSKRVDIGSLTLQTRDRYLNVKDTAGNDVFWVDDNGANIKALETQTDFVSLTDTANIMGDESSVLIVNEGKKIDFTKHINIDSVTSKVTKCDKLLSKSCNVDSLVTKSALGETSTWDKLHSDDITCRTIGAGELVVKKLKCDSFKTTVLDVENSKSEKVITNSCEAETFNCSKSVTASSASIQNLISSTIETKSITADKVNSYLISTEKGLIKDIETVNANITTLQSLSANIKELSVESVKLQKQVYGSTTQPLNLGFTQQKILELREGNYHKIISIVPCGVLTQAFYVTNVDVYGDWLLHCTLTKDNSVTATIITEAEHQRLKVNLNYKKNTEDNSLVILHLKK